MTNLFFCLRRMRVPNSLFKFCSLIHLFIIISNIDCDLYFLYVHLVPIILLYFYLVFFLHLKSYRIIFILHIYVHTQAWTNPSRSSLFIDNDFYIVQTPLSPLPLNTTLIKHFLHFQKT